MDRTEILAALRALGLRLHEKGIVGDLYVVGGAAITLAFDDRRATRDVDAVFVPKNEVYVAAHRALLRTVGFMVGVSYGRCPPAAAIDVVDRPYRTAGEGIAAQGIRPGWTTTSWMS